MRRLVCSVLLVAGCATYRDELNRGQGLYGAAHYEHALAIWRLLESDLDSLSPADQSRYEYLRGMTDYRLGLRADARHWLAIAKANNQLNPGGLDAQASAQIDQILEELNREIYSALPGPDPAEK